MSDFQRFILSNETGVCLLECDKAFEALTRKEKHYAHYLAQASWCGSLICLLQTSPESPGIFLLLLRLFQAEKPCDLKVKALELGFTEDDFQAFLIYAAGFLSNMGNYKSFGDTKFIPNLKEDLLSKLIENSEAFKADPDGFGQLWNQVKEPLFALDSKIQELGLGDKGITTYFSSNCDKADADIAQEFLNDKNLSGYNTRLFKYEEDGEMMYDIRLASAQTSGVGEGDMNILGKHSFQPKDQSKEIKFKVSRGDYAPLMAMMCENLRKAQEYASNDLETNMLKGYIQSFDEGSIPAHKEGSRHWIKNKGPIVETYIGFIESYRDPYGVRGEFEGFVAMVNKEMSAKFGVLVDRAERFLPLLPWPPAYEKDRFLRPDFTSLDVLAFGSSGIPAGINIPNYDDIRQTEGFKNVSLGNVLSSGYKDTKVTFLTEEDKEVYTRFKVPSFEVQVGLHELLGHGSGKLFSKEQDGTFNFDTEHVKHTESGNQIESWYEHGETWTSKFQALAQPYEECRAECVGLYLCLSSEVLTIFGHEGEESDNIIYVNWLNMVRAGLLSLEFYSPKHEAWGQAHMQARYVILRVLLEAGEGLVSIEKTYAADGEADLIIHLDRSKINTVGKAAIGAFLRKLQVYKATGDVKEGREMFERYSAVTDTEKPHFLSLRDIVLMRKQPRKMFVQCNTSIQGEDVKLQQYEGTPEALAQSFVDRFSDGQCANVLRELWDADKKYFV